MVAAETESRDRASEIVEHARWQIQTEDGTGVEKGFFICHLNIVE